MSRRRKKNSENISHTCIPPPLFPSFYFPLLSSCTSRLVYTFFLHYIILYIIIIIIITFYYLLTINSDVCTKYQEAAKIVNLALEGLVQQCMPGAKVLDLCEFGHTVIATAAQKLYTKKVHGQTVERGVAFPVCISVNDCVCNYSPLIGEERVRVYTHHTQQTTTIMLQFSCGVTHYIHSFCVCFCCSDLPVLVISKCNMIVCRWFVFLHGLVKFLYIFFFLV